MIRGASVPPGATRTGNHPLEAEAGGSLNRQPPAFLTFFNPHPRIVVKYNFKTLRVQMWHRMHSLYALSTSRTLQDNNSHYSNRCCIVLFWLFLSLLVLERHVS